MKLRHMIGIFNLVVL